MEWAILFPLSFSISHGDTTLSSAEKLAHGSWSWDRWQKPVLAVSPCLPLSEVTPSSGAVFTWPPLLRPVLCLKAWAPHRTQLPARPPQVFWLASEMAPERLTHSPVLRLFCTCRGTEGKTPMKSERKIYHPEGGMSPCPRSPEAAVSTVTCLQDNAVMSYGWRGKVEQAIHRSSGTSQPFWGTIVVAESMLFHNFFCSLMKINKFSSKAKQHARVLFTTGGMGWWLFLW